MHYTQSKSLLRLHPRFVQCSQAVNRCSEKRSERFWAMTDWRTSDSPRKVTGTRKWRYTKAKKAMMMARGPRCWLDNVITLLIDTVSLLMQPNLPIETFLLPVLLSVDAAESANRNILLTCFIVCWYSWICPLRHSSYLSYCLLIQLNLPMETFFLPVLLSVDTAESANRDIPLTCLIVCWYSWICQ